MTAASGFPSDPERRPGNEGTSSGAGGPLPDDADWSARFSAIVSGISPEMHWEVTEDDLDSSAEDHDQRDVPNNAASPLDGRGWLNEEPDTAEERRLRRELRRQERADALAAHLEAQAEFEAEMAADDEHFVPPPPPPLPKLRRRTVGALLLIAAGILLLAWPGLLPASYELILVLALLLILGGAGILVAGMRRHRGEPGEGWDDGSAV